MCFAYEKFLLENISKQAEQIVNLYNKYRFWVLIFL